MKPRGRPRKFDADTALEGAMMLFWEKGFSAASLDELGEAMGMSRPSIYNAFGNKESIYQRSLANFCGRLDEGIRLCLQEQADLRLGLQRFFSEALDIYCATTPSMGCLMICTAPAEALNDEKIKTALADLLKRVDKAFEKSIAHAIDTGQLSNEANPRLLAMQVQAILHTIALRARAGESKASLNKYAKFAVSQLPWVA